MTRIVASARTLGVKGNTKVIYSTELNVNPDHTYVLTLFHLIARQLAHTKKHLVSEWSMEDLEEDWLKFSYFCGIYFLKNVR